MENNLLSPVAWKNERAILPLAFDKAMLFVGWRVGENFFFQRIGKYFSEIAVICDF